MKNISLVFLLFLFQIAKSSAQLPNPVLVGYWHNWNDVNAPYVPLEQTDSRYNVIEVAFAVPTSPSDMTMLFVPDGISQSAFQAKIQQLKAQGRKTFISIGGATTSIDLTTLPNKIAFVNSITTILSTYGFDGIDIDIENGNSILATGSIAQPSSLASIHLIDAIHEIMLNYRNSNSKKLLLSLAPETAYVQGGQSAYGGIWGGYLPLLNALRDSIDLLQVQLYNSGSMYGLDGAIYTQGTADFIVAMTEAIIQGFSTAGGAFSGFPASKIAVGLPACMNAAGGGFATTLIVQSALNYLRGNGPKPGSYTLVQNGGYPSLRGLMTWSVNWDAVGTCGTSYEFAQNFSTIFSSPNSSLVKSSVASELSIYPNPFSSEFTVSANAYIQLPILIAIYSLEGTLLYTTEIVTKNNPVKVPNLAPGMYVARCGNKYQKIIKN